MTTPQQPARLVDSLHALTGEIQANYLVARLLERDLGKMVTAAEADSIVTLVAGIEQPRGQVAANVQQHDDAQQQAQQ